MVAKILKSNHSGIQVGATGKVACTYNNGYSVEIEVSHDIGGGRTVKQTSEVYFTKEEVEIIEEPEIAPTLPFDPPIPAEEYRPGTLRYKVKFAEGLPPGDYEIVFSKLSTNHDA